MKVVIIKAYSNLNTSNVALLKGSVSLTLNKVTKDIKIQALLNFMNLPLGRESVKQANQ